MSLSLVKLGARGTVGAAVLVSDEGVKVGTDVLGAHVTPGLGASRDVLGDELGDALGPNVVGATGATGDRGSSMIGAATGAEVSSTVGALKSMSSMSCLRCVVDRLNCHLFDKPRDAAAAIGLNNHSQRSKSNRNNMVTIK
jgi:hypothetical protein